MKKTLKKALAMIMSVSMFGSLAVPVFAEETAIPQPPYTLEEFEAMIYGDEIEFLQARGRMLSYVQQLYDMEISKDDMPFTHIQVEDIYENFKKEHEGGKNISVTRPYTLEELRSSVYYSEEEFSKIYSRAKTYNSLYSHLDLDFDETTYDADMLGSLLSKFNNLQQINKETGAKSTITNEQIAKVFDAYRQEVATIKEKRDILVQDRIDFIEDGGFDNCEESDSIKKSSDLADNEWHISSSFEHMAHGYENGREQTIYIPRDTKDGVENNKPYLSQVGYDNRGIVAKGFENYFETKIVDGINYVTLDGVDYEYYITADNSGFYFEMPVEIAPSIIWGFADDAEVKQILDENNWLTSMLWYDYMQSEYNRFWYYVMNNCIATERGETYEEWLLFDLLSANDLTTSGYETGDIDGDGEIEISSLEQLYPKCDMDGDGVEEFIDVNTYLANIDRIENVNLDDRHINLVGESSTEEKSLQSVLESDSSLVNGDVNLDGAIDVLDLGTLKLFVTKQSDFTQVQNYTATGNASTSPDIRNVTRMNQYLIKLVDEY